MCKRIKHFPVGSFPCQLIGIAIFLSLFAGCGAAMEHSLISSSFRTSYSCQPEITDIGGGTYEARGCGHVVHYTCYTPSHLNPSHFSTSVMGEARCVQEYTKQNSESTPPLTVQESWTGQNHIALQADFLVYTGILTMKAIPEEFPNQVAFFFKSSENPDFDDNCSVKLWANGDAIPIEGQQIHKNRLVTFAIESYYLSMLGRADRLVGNICGVSIEIIDAQREVIKQFDYRFREEIPDEMSKSSSY